MRPVLHHYPGSNFAEKVRLMLGLKGLAWDSVIIPDVMPKPELVALTGGYSKTPVLQLGADIHCDTRQIAAALELLKPVPSLYPNGSRGFAQIIQSWADGPFALAAARYLMGRAHDLWPPEFHADRAALWGVPVDLARMTRAAGRYRRELQVFLGWLAEILRDGRQFLEGSQPGLADCAAAQVVWFLGLGGARTTDVLSPFHEVQAWQARVADIGHGEPRPLSAAAALDIAREATPQGAPALLSDDAEGFRLGEWVSVVATEAGRDPVCGALYRLDVNAVAVRRESPRVGTVVVHFPRLGYVLKQLQ